MITNELIKENNYLLKTIFDNKPNLDLLLTSGNKPCYDLTYVEEYITEELPSCIFDFNYNNIYCDSRYISPEMAQSIKDNYNKEVIIKIFNNISYDKYKQFTCINYIENIKDYNTDIKNIYILNDDNILNDYSDNIELVDFKITKLTPELQKLFLKQEIKQFTKLKDNWEEYKKYLTRTHCLAKNTLTLDVVSNEILICTAFNMKEYVIGKIIGNEIVARNTSIPNRVLICNENLINPHCAMCTNNLLCANRCFYKSYEECLDPFQKNEKYCIYNKDKVKFICYIYSKIGVLELVNKNNDQELIKFIKMNSI